MDGKRRGVDERDRQERRAGLDVVASLDRREAVRPFEPQRDAPDAQAPAADRDERRLPLAARKLEAASGLCTRAVGEPPTVTV